MPTSPLPAIRCMNSRHGAACGASGSAANRRMSSAVRQYDTMIVVRPNQEWKPSSPASGWVIRCRSILGIAVTVGHQEPTLRSRLKRMPMRNTATPSSGGTAVHRPVTTSAAIARPRFGTLLRYAVM